MTTTKKSTAKPSKTRYKKEPVTFSEIGDVRYLHFGTPWVQGAMNVRRPYKLELEYARMMMAYLLFRDEPKRVAQLGMGCASLTKFTYKYLPGSHSTVVELNPDVIAAAYGMFRLPLDERIEVVEQDAALWVQAQKVVFDVLQIDLYDASARGPVCDSVVFYHACFEALKTDGMATINLFGDHPSFEKNMRNLHEAFGGRVIALPEIHEGNRIALAFKGAPMQLEWAQLYARADEVKALYGLSAKRWVSALKSVHPGSAFVI
ncbi:MAG: spermidine synthase [Burkholderiaceae bacterium]